VTHRMRLHETIRRALLRGMCTPAQRAAASCSTCDEADEALAELERLVRVEALRRATARKIAIEAATKAWDRCVDELEVPRPLPERIEEARAEVDELVDRHLAAQDVQP